MVDDGPGADIAVAGLLPDVMGRLATTARCSSCGRGDTAATSWALCRTGPGNVHQVRQHGPRRPWDEIAGAHRRWGAWGRPERERFGITVTPDGQSLWLDDPAHPHGT
ncbi:hypothetical protein [Actinomadura sp. CNU-125]|uniref:hypothetical protein n=1 Tax=Actinomadura sp. CNU-125 TaxID=1904961 RepID=UPI0011779406|nr:hypothetical protein [Actinomadura sp. CNU-125]